jgi:catechol 2,3-dioxygenase-like lactoylglutathione lyase family enzyme
VVPLDRTLQQGTLRTVERKVARLGQCSGMTPERLGIEAVMQVRNVRWIGVATENYEEMRELLAGVMGLRPNFDDPTTVEFVTREGDEIQLMAPGDPYFDFFREHAHGPVPLFEVDDVHAARAELERAGVTVVGDVGRDSRWEWIHFRAPDGNLYELASRRSEPS